MKKEVKLLDSLFNPTVVWLIVGIVLVALELAVPGVILVFFGFGALVASLASFLGAPTVVQWALFILASVFSLIFLRNYLKNTFFERKNLDEDEPLKTAWVAEPISPEKPGRVFFDGTTWEARSDTEHSKGEEVTVLETKGLVLVVTKKVF